MTRPPEITPDEWEMMTSPENYYCDGEVSGAQAEQILRQRVQSVVNQRRVIAQAQRSAARTPSTTPARRCSARTTSGSQCDRDAKRGFAFCWQHQNSGQHRAR